MFTFGIVSLYTVTLLAFERWFAVCRPWRYTTRFRSQNVRKYLLAVWLSSFAVNSTHIIETKFRFRGENNTQRCVFQQIAGDEVRVVIGVFEICIKFITPVIILLVTFAHLYHFLKDSTEAKAGQQRQKSHAAVTRVTHMAAVTSTVMVLCWFPNQVFYLLFKLNIVQLNTLCHRLTVILCMFNSCLNPCIFLFSNKLYRKKARELFPRCKRLMKRDISLADLKPISP